ncbi:phage holin family protein [Aerococcus tenax]|uniref:phage holin family protein n=1 Tax=Aerococcus tenax TaxID=3078812 RepID=UPI0018A72433|nr:phage holin family protein [Aerococcus tenax]
MIRNIIRLLIQAILLQGLGRIFWPAVYIQDFGSAVIVVLVIAILYKLVYPILRILALPINFLTLGLFNLVLNGFIFWLASSLMGTAYFWISSFFYCMVLALIYGLAQELLKKIFDPYRSDY